MKNANQKKTKTAKKPGRPSGAKKPGRPSGAKNRKYATIERIPAACKSCGATDLPEGRVTQQMKHAGTLPSGRRYTRVIWRQTQCQHCGQWHRVRSYEHPAGK